MKTKSLETRWLETKNGYSPLDTIKQLLNRGGALSRQYSPFEELEDGLADFRGLDLSNLKIRKIRIANADLSYSSFLNSWIEKSSFENVRFEKVDFRQISDLGNFFKDVSFLACQFNKAVLGYEGTRFVNCTFDYSTFGRTGFIRGEYTNCRFINCKLNGADFNASSFEDCSFVGKLENVWFRGGYGYSYGEREFGKAKKNKMTNVSFAKATLDGVAFSNDLDLSTVKLPETGSYLLLDNWKERLERLKNIVYQWPDPQKEEAMSFVDIYLLHAQTQDWGLINIKETQEDFGVDVANNIVIELNRL